VNNHHMTLQSQVKQGIVDDNRSWIFLCEETKMLTKFLIKLFVK
jgi:hypothetical protein